MNASGKTSQYIAAGTRRAERYAIKFAVDAPGMAPTDAHLSEVLESCARRPLPDEFPEIRRHVARYVAGEIPGTSPQS